METWRREDEKIDLPWHLLWTHSPPSSRSTTRRQTAQGASRGGVGEVTGTRQYVTPVRVEGKDCPPFRLPLVRLTPPHLLRPIKSALLKSTHNRLTTAPDHQLQLTRRRTRNRERRTSPMQIHRRAIPRCTRRWEVKEPQNGTESASLATIIVW